MESEYESSAPSWGARINFSRQPMAQACSAPRSYYEEQGLLIWEGERRVSLSAEQAIALLEHLREDNTWQQNGIVVGEPISWMVGPKGKRHPWPEASTALVNQIHLPPSRASVLLELLVESEAQLKGLAEEEQEDAARARHRVYSYLLSLASQRRAREESERAEEMPDDT